MATADEVTDWCKSNIADQLLALNATFLIPTVVRKGVWWRDAFSPLSKDGTHLPTKLLNSV